MSRQKPGFEPVFFSYFQEIVSIYLVLSPPNLTPAQSNRVCNALDLLQLKYLAEEMQAISKGLEKVVQELSASENDGLVQRTFTRH
ncbi:formin-like protein 14 [Henckelia pumila]|uniref:formin-like protein 14 n=1 Tax=Henckelia pumila TaxID=405737 RepID=UPI003C6DC1D8